MTDTSLVFNVLGRERVGSSLSRVAALFRSAGASAERATRQATQSTERLDREIHDVERSLAALNAEFAATGNKEIFARIKRDRGLLTQLQMVRREVGRANDEAGRLGDNDRAGNMLTRLASSAAEAGSSLASSAGSGIVNLSTNLWNLIPALTVAAAGLMALGPAAYLAGGAIGSLPGIISAAAAAMATLKLGTMGMSETWKAMTTSSGGAAKAARDMTSAHRAVEQATKGVARAERDVVEAQKAARAATLAVAAAVVEERRRRGELARDLAGARLDQEDAADAVTEAETALNAARANGAPPDEVADLDRAYRRAQLTLANTKVRVEELNDEQKKATETGVNGSDLVVAAKERERQALQRVTDAQEAQADAVQRLADAQKALHAPQGGGGGGGGPITPQIAKSAKEFLNVLKELKPAFKDLQLGVQEKLFAGLAGKFRTMATAWLPQLNTTLGGFATTFNGIAKTFMTTASKKTFIDNVAVGAEAGRQALDRIGNVVAGPLTKAFGQISKASAPFIKALGEKVAKALESFSGWIDKISKNKRLDGFFKDATRVMGQLGRSLKSIGSIAGSVMSILFGDSKNATGPFGAVADALDRLDAWLKDPETRSMILGWMDDLKSFGGDLLDAFRAVAPAISPTFKTLAFTTKAAYVPLWLLIKAVKYAGVAIKWVGDNAPKWWAKVSSAFGTAVTWVKNKGSQLVGWVRGLPGRIGSAASGMWNGIKNSFRSAINWIIGKWNNMSFTLPSATIPFLGTVGGGHLDTPNIPYLAKGGIVPASRGGRLAVLGEGGRDEAVIPLDRAGGMGGPTEIILRIAPGADNALTRALVSSLQYEVRTAGRGSAQRLLGPRGAAA